MTSFLFPGQGSQTKGMGADLFDHFPELVAKADKILGYSIKALCLEDANHQLNQTQFTQPAIYVVNALSYLQRLKQNNTLPDFVAGHSLGEYNALHAAGAISFEDGLQLVKKRGELMSQAAKGAMAAVLKLREEDIKRCLQDNQLNTLDIANYNAPTQIVISGLQEDIARAQACFETAGADYIPLNTSGAFHSRYMAPAQAEFEKYLEQFTFADLQIPVIANVSAEPYQQQHIKQNLAKQITHSVRWQQSMHYLLQQGDLDFEEMGMGDILTKLMVWIKTDFIAEGTKVNKDGNKHSSIDEWNNAYPIGTKVTADGFKEALKTRTKAMLLLGHREAIYIQGYKGYFALDDVTVFSD